MDLHGGWGSVENWDGKKFPPATENRDGDGGSSRSIGQKVMNYFLSPSCPIAIPRVGGPSIYMLSSLTSTGNVPILRGTEGATKLIRACFLHIVWDKTDNIKFGIIRIENII